MKNFLTTVRWGLALLVCALAAALAPGLAAAQPVLADWDGHTLSGRMLVDPHGDLTATQAAARFASESTTVHEPNRAIPFVSPMAVWFALDLPPSAQHSRAVLSLQYPGLDKVVLFNRQPDGGFVAQQSGDLLPVASWAVPHLFPAFELQLGPDAPRMALLQVRHGARLSQPWRLQTRDRFEGNNQALLLALGAYLGVLMLVLGLSLFNAVVWRDTLYLNYAAYVLSVGLVQMTLTGVGGQFFWPHHAVWNDLASVILPTLSAAMLVMFIQAVVADHASTLIRGVFAALVVIGVALAGAFLLFDRQLVFGLVNAYFLLVFALSTAVLIRYALRQRGHAWWFVAGLVSLFIGALFPVLRNYGLLSVSVWTQYGAQMGAAIEIPLLLVGLHLRSRQRRDAHVRSSALDTRDAMTGLANDRTTRQNLHAMVLRMKHKVHGGCVMRVRLANYNAIVQEFGLQAVGIAMVRATSCVNEAIRTEDMAGRLKNGDFVIQLEGRLDEDKAMQTGAKIVARGLATNKALPGNTTLKFHVALVVNPDGTQGADELLEQLDQLLASIARAPQRTVRVLRTVHVQAFRDSTLAPDDVA